MENNFAKIFTYRRGDVCPPISRRCRHRQCPNWLKYKIFILFLALFLHHHYLVYFHFHRSGNPNGGCDTKFAKDLPSGQWNKFIFAQYEKNGKFYNKLTINGSKVGNCQEIMLNTNPFETFENVQVRGQMKI